MAKYLTELPPTGRGKYTRAANPEHVKLAVKARRKPGQWMEARVFQTGSGAAHFAQHIREGRYLAFRDERWEATQRGNTVYVRYVGGDRV